MSGENGHEKLDGIDEACQGSSPLSVHCDSGNLAPPPNKWLHVQNWKLKKLLERKDAENKSLKTMLAEKDAQIDELTNKLKRMEAELVSEVEASGDLVVDMVAGKEKAARKLMTKDAEIQELKKTARRAEIEQYLWPAGLKTSSILQNQTDGMSAEEKVLHLFPDVLKIIIQNARKFDNCIHWRALLPLLTACRPVCNSWKESVDLIMVQDSSHIDLFPRGVNLFKYKRVYTPSPFKLSYNKFDDGRWNAKFKKLSRQLRANPSFNPIPTRHLLIETVGHLKTPEHDLDKWNKFHQMVTRYLAILGKHVWYLTINLSGSIDKSQDPSVAYKVLRQWLPSLPNVMSLAFDTGVSPKSMKSQGETCRGTSVSFPKFKDLVTFQGSRDSILTKQILNNNRRIKNLKLSANFDGVPARKNFLHLKLPNVSTFECNFDNLKDWEKLVKMSWSLKSLSLGYYSEQAPLSTKAFFEGIENFGKTLQSLAIDLDEEGCNDPEVNLSLPQLKHLHLRNHGWEPLSLNKIFAPLQLQKLESILMELSVSSGSPSDDEMWNFLEYVNELHENSDWMKFHKLRNVKVIVRVNGYELGEPRRFEVKRSDMSPVKFDVVQISGYHIWYWDRM